MHRRYLVSFIVLLSLEALIAPIAAMGSDLQLIGKSTVDVQALTFADGPATRFGRTVNGRSHQTQGIVTHLGYQYVAYVDGSRRICLGRRKLPDADWSIIRFTDHRFESNDSHNTAVIGICEKDGTIHVAFDHHATPLNYRVSKLNVANRPESFAWEPSLFGPIRHALGSVETDPRVTYPRFFSAPDGSLMLYYRAVTSGNGDGMIERYDGAVHDWVPGLGKFIARDNGFFHFDGKTSELRCPYMDPLSFASGRLHASWVWRDRFERTNPVNQHDLCYAYSDDLGKTWHNSEGAIIGEAGAKPIHLNTQGLVVVPIEPGNGLSNQNANYAFDDGSFHVMLRQREEGNVERQYHHYWRDIDGDWHSEILPFCGDRPKLVGAEDGVLFLIYSDEVNDNDQLFIARGIPNADCSHWNWEDLPVPRQPVCGEPLVDVARWKNEKVLSVYFQAAPKKIIRTRENVAVDGVSSPLHVMDFRSNRANKDSHLESPL